VIAHVHGLGAALLARVGGNTFGCDIIIDDLCWWLNAVHVKQGVAKWE
jgi:hypothetical protein